MFAQTTEWKHLPLIDATVENEYECVKSAIILFPVIINSRFALANTFVFWIDAQVLCHEAFIIQNCNWN